MAREIWEESGEGKRMIRMYHVIFSIKKLTNSPTTPPTNYTLKTWGTLGVLAAKMAGLCSERLNLLQGNFDHVSEEHKSHFR